MSSGAGTAIVPKLKLTYTMIIFDVSLLIQDIIASLEEEMTKFEQYTLEYDGYAVMIDGYVEQNYKYIQGDYYTPAWKELESRSADLWIQLCSEDEDRVLTFEEISYIEQQIGKV